MNTIVIEPQIYNGALNYAREHHTSVESLVRSYLASLIRRKAVTPKSAVGVDSVPRQYVSEKLRGFLTGKDYGKGLSEDYKKEIDEYRTERYL